MMMSMVDFENGDESPEQTRLYETCVKGSKEEIRNFCRDGHVSSQYLRDGKNPMHVIVTAGRKDVEPILDMMLQSGFNVNAQTKTGDDTVLHLIVENMKVNEAFPLVLKILEYGPDLTLRNRKLRTAYDIACARDESELAQVLDGRMTAGQAREFYVKKIGALYGAKLIEAVLNSSEQGIKEYLALGADPDFVNEHKNGAIHYAITHCKLPPHKTLSMLIEGGANINLQDDEGDPALNLIIKMTRLRETGDMLRCAQLLVDHGAISTLKDLDGNDALALAKKRNYADIVALLMSRRTEHIREPSPSPEPVQRQPDSFLQQNMYEPEEIPEYEPEMSPEMSPEPTPAPAPAPVPAPGAPGLTQTQPPPRPRPSLADLPPLPPPQARIPGDDDDDYDHPPPTFRTVDDEMTPQPIMADFLTPRDPEPVGPPEPLIEELEEVFEEEMTEEERLAHLTMATKEGTPQDVKTVLVELQPNPNIPDDQGLYPIHHVCIREFDDEEDRLEMIQALIDNEADINVKTVNSESSVLHIAATNNQDHVAKLLLDTHKCDYNAKNKNEQTAYEVAQVEESPEVMQVIDNHRQAVRDRMRKGAKKASICTLL